jgi:phage shock protein PspC (stress-responsive transcriptional regulator)
MRRVNIVRPPNRWIGGVAGGIAQRFGIDPLLVRAIFGISVLFGGAGLIIYGLGWALLPEQVDGRIHLQETIRGRFDAALLGAIAFFVIGINQGNGWFGWWDGNSFGWLNGILWFAATVAVIAIVIAAANQRGHQGPPTGPQGPAAPGAGPGAPSVYDYPTATYPAATYPTATYPTATVPPAPAAPQGAAGYGATGYYSGPPAGGYAGRPTAYAPPPQPRRPVKPHVYGPGGGAIGAVVGLSLVSLAALLVAQRQGHLDWSVALTAGGIAIVLAGLGIIIAGLRGRSSGTLGFLAIVGIILAVPAALFVPVSWDSSSSNVQIVASSGDWAPTTAVQAREGITVGVGDLNVDLTQLPVGDGAISVPITLGAGDLTVTVPRDTAISAAVRLSAGSIIWEVDRTQQVSGVADTRTYDFQSNEVTKGASPELALKIETGAGQVRIVEENS